MVTLSNGFADRGYLVDLVLAKAEGPYLTDVSDRVRIVDLHASRVMTSLPSLVRYLRQTKPAAMLSAMGHANVAAVVAKIVSRVPTRIIVSERANYSIASANAPSVRGRMIGKVMRWAYPRADGIIAVSAGVADDLAAGIGMPRDRIDVVYNPVVVDDVGVPGKCGAFDSWFECGQPPVILGAGRLVEQKGFSVLIRAFARVRESLNVRLVILGDGDRRGELEELVRHLGLENCVALPGFVDGPFFYMRRAKLFVLSSAWEGLPNVLIQAMACGLPVVSTDCPSGPAEILENGLWGRLVPVGDAESLTEAMAAALSQTHHPNVEARASAFNVPQAVQGYLDVLFREEVAK